MYIKKLRKWMCQWKLTLNAEIPLNYFVTEWAYYVFFSELNMIMIRLRGFSNSGCQIILQLTHGVKDFDAIFHPMWKSYF